MPCIEYKVRLLGEEGFGWGLYINFVKEGQQQSKPI
jgi:hypothetical protein